MCSWWFVPFTFPAVAGFPHPVDLKTLFARNVGLLRRREGWIRVHCVVNCRYGQYAPTAEVLDQDWSRCIGSNSTTTSPGESYGVGSDKRQI